MKMIVKDVNGTAREYMILQAELIDSDTLAYEVREIDPVHNLDACFKESPLFVLTLSAVIPRGGNAR